MDGLRIDANLRLVFPIRWGTDAEGKHTPLVWAYHTPISRDIFEANYRAISAANMTLFSKGVGFAAESGPILGTLALRDAVRADAREHGLAVDGDPAAPILEELKRLTLVLTPTAHGYETVPVDIAIGRGAIDAEDWKDAESSIVFFTCGWWMEKRLIRATKALALAIVLGGSTTFLPPTDFAASLQPSNPTETSLPVPTVSSVPS